MKGDHIKPIKVLVVNQNDQETYFDLEPVTFRHSQEIHRRAPLRSLRISISLYVPATAASSPVPTAPTTILKILGGKHLVEPDMVRVLGRPAFHDTTLISSGHLCYLGGEWRQDVAFAGFEVPIQMDISAQKMIFGVPGIDPQRRDELIKVLLLDEITVDLDVLARADLLRFLRKECDEMGATIIYATHIFDGLEDWPTNIRTVESWLRKERDEDRKKRKERKAAGLPEFGKQVVGSRVTGDPARAAVQVINNGWAAGRLNSTIAGEENFLLSSNRVLRQ
ncbi:hypothetical protein JHK84_055819 [Glycine max]|nr:hypothetical protein JHK84_055819 [Glycine max]